MFRSAARVAMDEMFVGVSDEDVCRVAFRAVQTGEREAAMHVEAEMVRRGMCEAGWVDWQMAAVV